jgi:hypothetical protein
MKTQGVSMDRDKPQASENRRTVCICDMQRAVVLHQFSYYPDNPSLQVFLFLGPQTE